MTQLDLALFVSPETGELNEQKLIDWMTKYRIGSLFNSPFAGHAGRCVLRKRRQCSWSTIVFFLVFSDMSLIFSEFSSLLTPPMNFETLVGFLRQKKWEGPRVFV